MTALSMQFNEFQHSRSVSGITRALSIENISCGAETYVFIINIKVIKSVIYNRNAILPPL
jgi:hypothetical protein